MTCPIYEECQGCSPGPGKRWKILIDEFILPVGRIQRVFFKASGIAKVHDLLTMDVIMDIGLRSLRLLKPDCAIGAKAN